MITLGLLLMCYFLFLLGTPILAGLGWLLDRVRQPERNREGGLPRLVGGTVVLFCAMFGMASALVIGQSDEAAGARWLLVLAAAVMLGGTALGGRLAVRALRRRGERARG